MNPTTIEPLTRSFLERFNQITARAHTPSHAQQPAGRSLKEVKKAVYALAWQLNRIGGAGRKILDAEELAIVGPDDIQSLRRRNPDLELDDVAFWEAKRRRLESYTSTIKLERVKGWVYKTISGLSDLGKDGHRVLDRAGVSLAGCNEVRYRPTPGEPEPHLNDESTFWEHKLQYLEKEYKQLRRQGKRPPAVAIEFLSSDSEVEEDKAEHARVEEYVFGWQGRKDGISAWVEAASTVTDGPCTSALIQDPASLHTDSGNGSGSTLVKGVRRGSISPTQSREPTTKTIYPPFAQAPKATKRKRPDQDETESISSRSKRRALEANEISKPSHGFNAQPHDSGSSIAKRIRQRRQAEPPAATTTERPIRVRRYMARKDSKVDRPTPGPRRSARLQARLKNDTLLH